MRGGSFIATDFVDTLGNESICKHMQVKAEAARCRGTPDTGRIQDSRQADSLVGVWGKADHHSQAGKPTCMGETTKHQAQGL